MDKDACNYNVNATKDDGTCEYAKDLYYCDGSCLKDYGPFRHCDGTCIKDADSDDICDPDEIFPDAWLVLRKTTTGHSRTKMRTHKYPIETIHSVVTMDARLKPLTIGTKMRM